MTLERVCIIGAGNGGFSMAGTLAIDGHEVTLYELPRFEENIKALQRTGVIEVTGEREGFGTLKRITTDIGEAIEDVQYLFVTTQALAHEEIAYLLAPYICPKKVIFLLPGSGGSLLFAKIFQERAISCPFKIGETLSLPYACRKTGPTRVNISRVLGAKGGKNGIGAFPGKDTEEVLYAFQKFYPNTFPMTNALEAGLCNSNFLKHPVVTLLNAGRIEYSRGDFYCYREGMTPSIMKVMEALDKETRPLFKELGFQASSIKEVDAKRYEKGWEDRHKEIEEIGSKGPTDVRSRYITEDVPMGLVLMASIGRYLKVKTPTFDAIIQLASIITETDYWKDSMARTTEKMGFGEMSKEDLLIYLREGQVKS